MQLSMALPHLVKANLNVVQIMRICRILNTIKPLNYHNENIHTST